jgi:hypothetical protein
LRSDLERAVARTIDSWVARQRPDGTFPDPFRPWCLRRCGGYDEAILGYALLLHGLRSERGSWLDASARALRAVLATPAPRDGTFEPFALASSYRLLRAWLAGDRATAQDSARFAGLAGELRERVRQLRPLYIGASSQPWNKPFVEAVTAIEIARSDVAADGPDGTFAGDAAELAPLALAYLAEQSRKLAARSGTRTASGPAAVVSDPPYFPAAYHALTTAFLARGLGLVRDLPVPDRVRAVRSLTTTIVRGVRATAYLAAPDGDIAWRGRSQEQAWALAFAAYAAASTRSGCGNELAALLVRRLLARYRRADGSLAITPLAATATDARAYDLPVELGLDWYASDPAYSGLTLAAVGWLIEALDAAQAARARSGTPGRGRCLLPGERRGAWVVGRGRAAVAIARARNDWVAFGARSSGDLRIDVGLLAWKHRDAHGRWRDVVPLRPIGSGSAGPFLVRRGRLGAGAVSWFRWQRDQRTLVGRVCFRSVADAGSAQEAARRAAVLAAGGDTAGGCLWRRTFRARVGEGKVTLVLSARPGDVLIQALFLPATWRVARDARGVRAGRLLVTSSGLVAASPDRTRYASATERNLRRITLVVRARRGRRLALQLMLGR